MIQRKIQSLCVVSDVAVDFLFHLLQFFSSSNSKQLENQLWTMRDRMRERVTETKRVINVELEIHQIWSKYKWEGKHFTAATKASLTNKFHQPKKKPHQFMDLKYFAFSSKKKSSKETKTQLMLCVRRLRIGSCFCVKKNLPFPNVYCRHVIMHTLKIATTLF